MPFSKEYRQAYNINMKTAAKLIFLFLIVIVLGVVCLIGEKVYDSIGLFGPILVFVLLGWFLSLAFRN